MTPPTWRRFFDPGFDAQAIEAARGRDPATNLLHRLASTPSWPVLFAGIALGLVVASAAFRASNFTAGQAMIGGVGLPSTAPDLGAQPFAIDTASGEWKLLLRALTLQKARNVADAELERLSARDSSTGYSLARAKLVARIAEIDDSLATTERELGVFGIVRDSSIGYAAAAMTDSLLVRVRSPIPPWVWWIFVPIGALIGLAVLAMLALALRQLANPVAWHLVCLVLLAAGIFCRQEFLGASPAEATQDLMIVVKPPKPAQAPAADSSTSRLKGANDAEAPTGKGQPGSGRSRSIIFSMVLALAVFPSAIRWLNRLKPDPGLEHVALPFALGFFLDLAKVAALHWIPQLFK